MVRDLDFDKQLRAADVRGEYQDRHRIAESLSQRVFNRCSIAPVTNVRLYETVLIQTCRPRLPVWLSPHQECVKVHQRLAQLRIQVLFVQ